jgi:aryl sulfotransferase
MHETNNKRRFASVSQPKLIRPAVAHSRSRVFDSERWGAYRPRPDDIVVATYSKCGTTWTQHIVGMLIRKSAAPANLAELSVWPDARFLAPLDATWAQAEAQTHRRFFKSHLPLTALPLYEGVKYIHVARDGRDAAMSLHNHLANFTEGALAGFDAISLADPKFATPFPRVGRDAAAFFHEWITNDEFVLTPEQAYFALENTYWAERERPNVLLVHYNDLKLALKAEIRRIADFLEIAVSDTLLHDIAAAASFDAMKANGDKIMPYAQAIWDGGAARFLHKGTNGRWHDVISPADAGLYERRLATECPPALARWLQDGRQHGVPGGMPTLGAKA